MPVGMSKWTNEQRAVWYARRPDLARDRARRGAAKRGGFLPPPPEAECPPRPADGLCETCGKSPAPDILLMHHNHDTGEFVAWACARCNLVLSPRYRDDFGQPLTGSDPWADVRSQTK